MISNSSLNHLFGANTWSHRKKSDRYILNVKNETSPIYKDFQDWKINRKDIIFPVSCFFPCYHPVSCIDISNFRIEKIRTIYFPLKFSPVNQHFESFHIFPIPCPCSNETFVIWCEIKTVFYNTWAHVIYHAVNVIRNRDSVISVILRKWLKNYWHGREEALLCEH